MKRKLFWLAPIGLVLLLLAGAFAWLMASESGLRWAQARVATLLPGTLQLQRLDGRLVGPLHVEGLRYRDAGTDLRIDRLTFDWSPLALLAGRLHIDELSVNGVRLGLRPSTEPKPSAGLPTLPLSVRIERLELADIRIERAGQTPYAIESLELAVRTRRDVFEIERFEIRAQDFELSAQGALAIGGGSERLTMAWRVTPPGAATLTGDGEISGNLSKLAVVQRLSAPVSAVLQAHVSDLFSKPKWTADLNLPPAALNKLKPGQDGIVGLTLTANGDRARFQAQGKLHVRYPALPDVNGTLRAHGNTDGGITLDELALTAGAAKLIADAKYHVRGETVDLRLRWNNLQWPLAGTPSVRSPSGELRIDGTLRAYRVALTTETARARVPAADWTIAGHGDGAHVAFDTVVVKTLGGAIQGNARVAWTPRLAWDAQLDGKALNPSMHWREWPGAIAFTAHAAGNADDIDLELSQLGGQLRGQSVDARARVVRRGAHYPVLAAALQHGNARVDVTGGLEAQWDLSWQVDVPDLAAVLPHAAGRIAGNGHVGGNRDTPALQARLNAAGVAYEETRIEKLDVDAAVDLADRSGSRIDVRLADALLAERTVTQLILHADGYLADHTATVDVAMAGTQAQLRLIGAYREREWRATLADGALTLGGQRWTLANRPRILAGAKRLALDNSCWSAAPAQICARVDWNSAGESTAAFTAERAPLALFAALLPQPVELQGRFDASAKARINAGRIVDADAGFEAAAGSARLATSETGTAFDYRQVRARLRIDASGLRADAAVTLAGGDGGNMTLALPQFDKSGAGDATQPVAGQLKLTIRDLAPLAALLPDLRNLTGALDADIALAGTLADPAVRGRVQLTDASARIVATGILVRDVRLIVRADGRGQLRLNGFVRSGNGELGLSGTLNLEKGLAWRADVHIVGSDFYLVDLPDTEIDVSPDLRVRLAPGEVNVEGAVVIPRARITMRPRPASVTPSPDVVVVGDADTANAPVPRWNVGARIQLTLGDHVAFDGFGLTGNISGSLAIVDTPDQVPTARGELRIANGKYEAYGQKLEIERGRLLFVGGPVDDPGVDVRAVRHIDQIVAGVEVRGTLKSAELTLFSDPAMSDSDALSYLLFGKPLESANAAQGATLAAAARALKLAGGERLAQRLGQRFGIEEVDIEKSPGTDQAALVLGKHLSPRLYINYSIGLFESVNVFRIRYQLATHWILQAESGDRKGGDLLYTIER